MIEKESHFNDLKFKKERIENAQLISKIFLDCTFDNCSFNETAFYDCRFDNCLFEGCDLSLVKVQNSRFSDIHFINSKIIGVNWTQANWSYGQLNRALSFSKCDLHHSTFIGLSLLGLEIIDCAAVDVDFRECNLTKADFSGTDLSDSLFLETDLTEANFQNAYNYRIHPGKNTLTRAQFSLPEAISLLYSLDIDLNEV